VGPLFDRNSLIRLSAINSKGVVFGEIIMLLTIFSSEIPGIWAQVIPTAG